jgi:hypothetical protein
MENKPLFDDVHDEKVFYPQPPLYLRRRPHQNVFGNAGIDVATDAQSALGAVPAISLDHHQIDVGIIVRCAIGVRPEQDDSLGLGSPSDLVDHGFNVTRCDHSPSL